MKPVPFTIYPAEPTKVIVEAADGRRYEILLKILVTEVVDQETPVAVATEHGPVHIANLTVSTQTAWNVVVNGTDLAPTPARGSKVSTGELN